MFIISQDSYTNYSINNQSSASDSCLVVSKHKPFRRSSKARGKARFAVGLAKARSFRLASVVGSPTRCDFSSASDHLASSV